MLILATDYTDWDKLLKKCDHLETLIIKHLYFPEPKALILGEIHHKFKEYGITMDGLRKKIRRLDQAGVIDIVPTKPLCINAIHSKQEVVGKLIIKLQKKLNME